jgi:hypothetical protein
MDGVRADRIAGSVVDRHVEREFDHTKRTTPGSAGSEPEAWSYQRGVEGPEKEPIQNRHGSFNADQTPAQLWKRIAVLDLWLRELERNRF